MRKKDRAVLAEVLAVMRYQNTTMKSMLETTRSVNQTVGLLVDCVRLTRTYIDCRIEALEAERGTDAGL